VTVGALAAYVVVVARFVTLVCLAAAIVLTAACGGHNARVESQPAQHVGIDVSQTPPTSHRFGHVSQIPSSAPQWLVIQAHLMANALHDPQPDRVRIRLGRTYLIEMWGRFRCDQCSRPSGAKAPRGTHAWERIEPRTRRGVRFSLAPR
jgi:hypothetical protein